MENKWETNFDGEGPIYQVHYVMTEVDNVNKKCTINYTCINTDYQKKYEEAMKPYENLRVWQSNPDKKKKIDFDDVDWNYFVTEGYHTNGCKIQVGGEFTCVK